MNTTPLILYLKNQGTDNHDRYLSDIWQFDNFQLEYTHNYMQWMFPSDIPSQNMRHSPVLTPAEREVCMADETIQQNFLKSLNIILDFLGIVQQGEYFALNENSADKYQVWLTKYNHNHLRLSRLMRSLALLGQRKSAENLQTFVIRVARDSGKVSDETISKWAIILEGIE